jgi:hypothetical protein
MNNGPRAGVAVLLVSMVDRSTNVQYGTVNEHVFRFAVER